MIDKRRGHNYTAGACLICSGFKHDGHISVKYQTELVIVMTMKILHSSTVGILICIGADKLAGHSEAWIFHVLSFAVRGFIK